VRREEGLVTDGFAVIEGRGQTSANGIFCNRAISMRSNAISLDYLYRESRWRHCREGPTNAQQCSSVGSVEASKSAERIGKRQLEVEQVISFVTRHRLWGGPALRWRAEKRWDFSRTLSPIAAHRWTPTSTAG
jgi:hypothetical protein